MSPTEGNNLLVCEAHPVKDIPQMGGSIRGTVRIRSTTTWQVTTLQHSQNDAASESLLAALLQVSPFHTLHHIHLYSLRLMCICCQYEISNNKQVTQSIALLHRLLCSDQLTCRWQPVEPKASLVQNARQVQNARLEPFVHRQCYMSQQHTHAPMTPSTLRSYCCRWVLSLPLNDSRPL